MAEVASGTLMKRIGRLKEQITSFTNLLEAFEAAAAGKRKRPDVSAFEAGLEWELARLRRELLDGSYRPGPYRTILIRDPKPREISAAPFRDRVVHHALTRVLEPEFERRFSPNSFACRKGKGTHRALRKAIRAARKYEFVLKVDVRKYFTSIDKGLLIDELRRVVKCEFAIGLAKTILDGFTPRESNAEYFPGDDLFTPFERERGLPLGNQTSQFFANVYLNRLDQFVDRELQPGAYARYVDDLVLFGDSLPAMRAMRRRIFGFLATMRLRPHPGKSRLHRCREGLTFLGFRIFPEKTRLARQNLVRFDRKLRGMRAAVARGAMAFEDAEPRVRAWIAHASHGDTWQLRSALFLRYPFRRGARPRNAGRFVQQQ